MNQNKISLEECINYPIKIPQNADIEVKLEFKENYENAFVYYKSADTGYHNSPERAYILNKGKVPIINNKASLWLLPIGVYKEHWNNYLYSKKHIHYRICFTNSAKVENTLYL
jgi:hypothetical protein